MPASLRSSAEESERLERLRELVVLDTPPEAVFDSIARLASDVCGVPIALLSLVDAERQWFKANVGLPGVNETSRDVAFCDHAIRGDALFEVTDATYDARFDTNPLVTGEPGIRFYAGAPLVVPGGARIGTLCVIDRQARRLGEHQARMLESLAQIATQALVMRRELIDRSLSVRSEAEDMQARSEAFLRRTGRVAGVGGWEVDLVSDRITWSEQTRRIHAVGPDYQPTLDGALDFYPPEARPPIEAALQAALADGTPWDLELPFVDAVGRPLHVRTVGEPELEDGRPVRLVGALQDITERVANERALRELTEILDHTTDFVVQTDRGGRVCYMNPACRKALGLAPDADLSDRRFSDFNTAETNALFGHTILPAVQTNGVWVGRTMVQLAGGRAAPVSHMVLAHRNADGRIERYSAVMRDVTAQVQAEREIVRQTSALTSVTEAIPASVSVIGADGRYRFVNGAFERWCGLPRERIVGSRVRDVLGEDEHVRRRPWAARAFDGEAVSFEQHYAERETERYQQINYIPLRLDDGAVDDVVVVANDITRHKDEQGRLLQLAQRDPLTGLLNRAGFEQALQAAMQADSATALALLYIDLDRFKPINDRHGHPVGDQVLKLFASRLAGSVRPTDIVARVGGDEFAVVLLGLRGSAGAGRVADKVIEAATTPFVIGSLALTIGASVGIASGAAASGWEELVEQADAMLYQAKQAGRGRRAGCAEGPAVEGAGPER